MLWAEYFPGMNPEQFFQQLDVRGRDMGIRFGPQMLMSNSRKALEGGEFAKKHGKYEAYHETIFHAFFTDCKDIGKQEVILEAAGKVGLNTEILNDALDNHTYLSNLKKTIQMARNNMVTAAPTFIINGQETITGAQSIGIIRAALQRAIENKS